MLTLERPCPAGRLYESSRMKHRLRQEPVERSVRLSLRAKLATLIAKHDGSAEEAQESEVCSHPRGPALLEV